MRTMQSVKAGGVSSLALPSLLSVLLGGALLLAMPSAHAENKQNGEAKRLQQQIRKLEKDKSSLNQEKSALESKLKEATDQATAEQAKAQTASKHAAGLGREVGRLKESLSTSEKSLADTAEALKKTEVEKKKLELELAQHKQQLTSCSTKNDELHKLGYDLMQKYEHKTCGDSLVQREPFTGLKQVQIENELEVQRDKLDDQVYRKPGNVN